MNVQHLVPKTSALPGCATPRTPLISRDRGVAQRRSAKRDYFLSAGAAGASGVGADGVLPPAQAK